MDKWAKQILRAVERQDGWSWRNGSKHVVIYPSDGSRPIPIPPRSKKEGWRKRKNMEAMLRGKGLRL